MLNVIEINIYQKLHNNLPYILEDDQSFNHTKNGLPLRVLVKTRRTSAFSPPGHRSKYIFIPSQVKMANNHFIYEFQKGIEVIVPTDVGILQHYRGPCEEIEMIFQKSVPIASAIDPSIDCTNRSSTVDNSVHKYTEKLLRNVKSALREISGNCILKNL